MIQTNATTPRRRLAGAVLLVLTLALSGCAGESDDPAALTSAQVEEARQMRQKYDAALAAGDYNGATQIADRLRKKYPGSEAMAKVRESLDDTIARAEAQVESQRLAALWQYQATPAGEGTQYTALIPSHVELDADGLPERPADARLVLRVHPEWGKSAYLLLAQSQFACGDPCTVQIAFDDAPPAPFVGEQADSGNGPALFIEERERFYLAMQAASVVKITLPKTGGVSAPTLRFDVSGYEPTRLGTQF
jgi:hypothetical protein